MKTLLLERSNPSLIRQLHLGNEQAFRTIYEQNYQKVYRFAYSFLKDRNQTEEVVQETFLNVWTHREKLDEHLLLEPYLFTVTRRHVIDIFRRMTSSRHLKMELWQRLTALNNETEETILVKDLAQFTEKAIATLPKQQKLVFQMRRVDNLSYDEIAEQLHISKNTVKNHLVAALKTLKAYYLKHDMFYVFFVFFLIH